MTNTEQVLVSGIRVQVDTNGNFYGYAFRLNLAGAARLYTEGGFTDRVSAIKAARTAIRKARGSKLFTRLVVR